jgi:probable biosynthetic protein (TIGR04099 family)
MNVAFPLPEVDEALAARDASMLDRIVLGMPHLSLGGLSETWLLKELGHRHWQPLARLAGRTVPDFRDAEGSPVYAAFCAVTITDAAFDALREHDELSISSRLARISRTQFASLHELRCRGRDVGRVELSSVFVKRGIPGCNRSVARVALDLFPPVSPAPGFGGAAALAARLRGAAWEEHFGFTREEGRTFREITINPCPSQDFNGADFLYFAAFQSFVDRAEWEFFDLSMSSTRGRDIIYYGNVEIGDRVKVALMAERRSPGQLEHWSRIIRCDDGAQLADIFTRKSVLEFRAGSTAQA